MKQEYFLDVISCAAPFFRGLGHVLPNGNLEHLLKRRIRNIFEAAIDNSVEVLILGAFGYKAFHNPPDIVANAFRETLFEKRYRKEFDIVIFAVKRNDIICDNIETFEANFSDFPSIHHIGDERKHRLSKKSEKLLQRC